MGSGGRSAGCPGGGLVTRLLRRAGVVLVLWCAAYAKEGTRVVIPHDTLFRADYQVPAGTICIIEPGVTISFAGYHRLVVEGMLIAEGTSSRPILFTAANRTRGSRDEPGWKGVEVRGSEGYGRFVHCRFEGAYRNLVWGASAVFDSCEFSGNHYALYCAAKARPHISNSRFHGNRIAVSADFAAPLLLDNRITDNLVGVHLQVRSEGIVGRNIIMNNRVNLHSETPLGSSDGSTSLHHLWNLMQQLY